MCFECIRVSTNLSEYKTLATKQILMTSLFWAALQGKLYTLGS